MPRYVIRPRADTECDWWTADRIQPVPQVSDHQHVDTGLVDRNGNSIWRSPNPIGFGKDEEW